MRSAATRAARRAAEAQSNAASNSPFPRVRRVEEGRAPCKRRARAPRRPSPTLSPNHTGVRGRRGQPRSRRRCGCPSCSWRGSARRQRAGHGAFVSVTRRLARRARRAGLPLPVGRRRGTARPMPSDRSTPTMTCSKPADTTVVGTGRYERRKTSRPSLNSTASSPPPRATGPA